MKTKYAILSFLCLFGAAIVFYYTNNINDNSQRFLSSNIEVLAGFEDPEIGGCELGTKIEPCSRLIISPGGIPYNCYGFRQVCDFKGGGVMKRHVIYVVSDYAENCYKKAHSLVDDPFSFLFRRNEEQRGQRRNNRY